jgi:hypothetical protein
MDTDSYDGIIQHDLNMEVTNENKDEYIQRVIEWRFINRVKKQMDQVRPTWESIPLFLRHFVCAIFAVCCDTLELGEFYLVDLSFVSQFIL